MQKVSLDETDLRILGLLAKDGRLSYRNIARTVGLTTKSAKYRVDRMLGSKVIDRFLTRINPFVLGYSRTWVFALRKKTLTSEIFNQINLVGEIQYQFEVIGGIIGFDVAIRDGDSTEDRINRLLDSLGPVLLHTFQTRNRQTSLRLTHTDYSIIKQLIINPRMEIGKISASSKGISSKTVRRRIDKMTSNHVLEFSIQPNPDAMKGYIVYFLDVRVEDYNRGSHQNLLEQIYQELHDRLPLSSNMSNQVNNIGLLLAAQDPLEIENTRSRIESLDGIKQSNAFLPIKLSCPQDWVLKAIDRKLAESMQSRRF